MLPQLYYFSSKSSSNKILVGFEDGGISFKKFMNKNIRIRDMKILFYNLIKAFHYLKEINIVHNDITPENIIIKSIDEIKIIDFGISFINAKNYEGSNFPSFIPSKYTTDDYLSPELMTQRRFHHKISYVLYDPFKSDIFSLGLCLLSVFGLNIKSLNYFGLNCDVFMTKMITLSYDYIVKDSLKRISYKFLKNFTLSALGLFTSFSYFLI